MCIIRCLQYSHQCLLHAAAVAVAVVATIGADAPTCSYLRKYLHGARGCFANRNPVTAASFVRRSAVQQITRSLAWTACHATYVLTNYTWWRAESSSGANGFLEAFVGGKAGSSTLKTFLDL